jgi:DNA-directed RNA polymerase specialized sigma24 family protein
VRGRDPPHDARDRRGAARRPPQLLERISHALDELATHDLALAELVDLEVLLRFSFSELAAMRDVSERTVKRRWEKSRIYLHRALGAPARFCSQRASAGTSPTCFSIFIPERD